MIHSPLVYRFPSHQNKDASNESIVYQTSKSAPLEKFRNFLGDFTDSILKLNLKQKDLNSIFKLSVELVNNYKQINESWFADHNPVQSLDLSFDIVCNHFRQYKSNYQRDKLFASKVNFVMPVEKSIGTRWELRKLNVCGRFVRVPRLIQCVMQYVPILDTLKQLFSSKSFCDMYFDYNEMDRSSIVGRDGSKSYTCFESGSVFNDDVFFKANPSCIKLQVAYDDLEICNPLQSKSNYHKICAVYLSIHNVPPKFQSKLKNVFLICLCNNDDLKTKQTDINNIWLIVRNEISELEVNGINTYDGRNVKGTLVHVLSDNLGYNSGLGFCGGFNSRKYCRLCIESKSKCQSITHEPACTLRTIENYEESLEKIDDSEKVNYDETNGIKFYCVLSDLEHFHIVKNATVDPMHDINEGCATKFLCAFFKYCLRNKIFSSEELENLTKYYDYGSFDVPASIIDLEKKNLGQNAAQSMCLFRNIPFILHKWRNNSNLSEIWKCYQALLYVCDVVYSYEVTEFELQKLENSVALHLHLFMKIFQISLIPKQHFLVHYATVIRAIGPLIFCNMMRFDSKHRIFKIIRNATNNFKAINKTLAHQHKKNMSMEKFSYIDDIESSVLRPLRDENIINFMHEKLTCSDYIYEAKILHLNLYKYVRGSVVVYDKKFHEICYILQANKKFYFVCTPLINIEFDLFLNSFLVQKPQDSLEFSLISLESLIHCKPYAVKLIHDKKYIMSQSLDLHNHLV